jgi:hypothetical protein
MICYFLYKGTVFRIRIRIRIHVFLGLPDPDPDPDFLVEGMDPRIQIRIRIHTKVSWIRNTAKEGALHYMEGAYI